MLNHEKGIGCKFGVLLFIAALFLQLNPLNANHILGGEIQYTAQGNNKYRFKVRVYRNCNECEFNSGSCANITELDILLPPEVNKTPTVLGKIPITRISRRDVTPMCAIQKSSCAGGSFNAGIEEWCFEGDYDFTALLKNNCQFEISLKVDSRLDAWNLGAGEAFYNFTRLNICESSANSSPDFKEPGFFLLPYNQSFTHQITVNDPDGDSISWELVSAQKGFNRDITYGTGFSYQKPLSVNCTGPGCPFLPRLWPVAGLGIDPHTGWLAFTPVVNGQNGFLVLQCNEWRKIAGTWKKVGVSRRDMQFTVVDQNNFSPRVSQPALKDTFFACAGEDLGVDISVYDQPYFGVKDSVKLGFEFPLPGWRAGIAMSKGPNEYDASWNFKPSTGNIVEKPYLLTIRGTDNRCPLQTTNIKNLFVWVLAKPDASFSASNPRCNLLRMAAGSAKKGEEHSWFIFDSAGMIETRFSPTDTIQVPHGGRFKIVHQVKNAKTGCYTEQTDSVWIPYFRLMTANVNWPGKVCVNTELTLQAAFTGGTAPYRFTWNGISGAAEQKIKISKPQHVDLLVEDKLGCTLQYNAVIEPWPDPVLKTTDTARCLPPPGMPVSMRSRFSVSPDSGAQNRLLLLNGSGAVNGMDFFAFTAGTATLLIKHTTVNGCLYTDTFSVQFVNPPPTGIVPFKELCSNDAVVNLNSFSGTTIQSGKWVSMGNSPAFQHPMFNPAAAGAGLQKFAFEAGFGGCIVRDTMQILVKQAPQIQFPQGKTLYACENSANVTLLANPPGGSWKIPLTNGSTVSPSFLAASGLSKIWPVYSYTDLMSNCSATDSVLFVVNRKPTALRLNDTTICSGQKLGIFPFAINSSGISWNKQSGAVKTQMMGNGLFVEGGEVKTPHNAVLQYRIKALPGCPDSVSAIQVRVKPLPGIKLTASPAEACVPFTSTLNVESDTGRLLPDKLTWNIDMSSGNAFSKSLAMGLPGSREVIVYHSREGCEGEPARLQVVGRETPEAAFKVNPENALATADYPRFVFRNQSRSTDSLLLFWTFTGGKPAAGFLPVYDVLYPADTGRYNVKLAVKSKYGCFDQASRTVIVRPKFYLWVPTAFTPDSKGPGINEGWGVFADSMVEFDLIVRNKWGEMVFRAGNQNARWDGNYMGLPAPNGAYAWQLEGRSIYGRYIYERGVFSLMR